MKFILISVAAFLSLTFVSTEECGAGAIWEPIGHSCKYRCTPSGVLVDCSSNGCQCVNFDHYYNLDTKSCSEVNCSNMNCAGRQNEYFFKGCQSSSKEWCGKSGIAAGDCRQGCMCQDGFCRKDGVCVPRG